MSSSVLLLALVVVAACPAAAVGRLESGAAANPLSKVVQLLDDLTAKISKEGEAEAKAFTAYSAWCDDAAHNAEFAIQTAQTEKEKLTARIGELASTIQAAETKIGELAASIATAESELKDAALIRGKEASDFAASEAELMAGIDTLGRAVGLVEKDMARNPAAFAQMVDASSVEGIVRAVSTIVDAAALPVQDQRRLQALLQAHDGEDDEAFGAPAAAVYKTHSGGILDVLEDLRDKAEAQLGALRKTEGSTRHNYDLLAQSLADQKAADSKSLDDEKAGKAAAEEAKATAEGDLQKTEAFLGSSHEELDTTHTACLTTAADHDATVAARAEELKTLAKAKQILAETTKGAEGQSYSLLQLELGAASGSSLRLRTREDLTRSEVIAMVRNLAKRYHSAALAQLVSRIAAVAKLGAAAGEDPFAKIKGLIQDLISKLESEAGADATEKAYCDHELAKTEEKKGELDEDIAKLTAKIDQAASASAELKEEVQVLGSELAALAKEQAELDGIRQQTHADYVAAKADLELGLSGVRQALGVLRDYYAAGAAAMLQDDAKFGAFMQQPSPPEKHGKAAGAGQSIIGILEVVESDFASNLAKEENEEADAQSEYEKVSQENAVTKTSKEQDAKYKTSEAASLDKTIAELTADRDQNNAELGAVLEYYSKIKERCIAKPETYEERKRRREAEVEGLKAALRTLEEETAFVQRRLRGSQRPHGGALVAQQ